MDREQLAKLLDQATFAAWVADSEPLNRLILQAAGELLTRHMDRVVEHLRRQGLWPAQPPHG